MPRRRIPYLKDAILIAKANEFLAKYNPENTTPVDIEKIIEISMGIRIVPYVDLRRLFGIDSYLAIGKESAKIVIDNRCFEGFEPRTRFSYAHEIAHYLLHKDFYEDNDVQTEEKYLVLQDLLTIEERKSAEYQAYSVAGYILVPRNTFREKVDIAIKECGGIEALNILDLQNINCTLSKDFLVSEDVIGRQLGKEYPEIEKAIRWKIVS